MYTTHTVDVYPVSSYSKFKFLVAKTDRQHTCKKQIAQICKKNEQLEAS